MVSHSYTEFAHVDVPCDVPESDDIESWKADMWQHMLNVKNSSFSKAIKRRNQAQNDSALCESFDSLCLSRRKYESLESKMKKLCLGPASPTTAAYTSTSQLLPLLPAPATTTSSQVPNVVCLPSRDPECVKPALNTKEVEVLDAKKDLDACDGCPDDSKTFHDDLMVNGNGEADLKSSLMSPGPAACPVGLNARSKLL